MPVLFITIIIYSHTFYIVVKEDIQGSSYGNIYTSIVSLFTFSLFF